jgi:hypothetical protein
LTLRRLIPQVLTLTAVLIASVPSAYAYKSAFVQSDNVVMRQSPSDSGAPAAKLRRGTRVNTSDNPTAGYYRARSASAAGWIRESDLNFDMSAAPPPPSKTPQASNNRKRPPKKEAPLDYGWTLSAVGGLDLWSTSQINTVIKSTSLNTGGGYGAELGYRFSRNWVWLFRFEHLAKSASGYDQTGTVPISTSVAATALMTGLQYHIGDSGDWTFDFGALLGLALNTQFVIDTENDGNPATYQASTVTALLKFDVNYHLFDSFWVFFEPGYRILSTSQFQQPSSVGSASATTIGFLQSGGAYQPLNVNLGGPVVNFGARLNF